MLMEQQRQRELERVVMVKLLEVLIKGNRTPLLISNATTILVLLVVVVLMRMAEEEEVVEAEVECRIRQITMEITVVNTFLLDISHPNNNNTICNINNNSISKVDTRILILLLTHSNNMWEGHHCTHRQCSMVATLPELTTLQVLLLGITHTHNNSNSIIQVQGHNF